MMLAACSLSSCGTYVPNIQEFYETPGDAARLINDIIENVKCEVKTSVQTIILQDMKDAKTLIRGAPQERKTAWLDTWAAQAVLNLTIEEKTSLSPGLSLNTPVHNAVTNFAGQTVPGSVPSVLNPAVAANTFGSLVTSQSYIFGLGGTASADAMRKETLSLFIDFKTFTDRESLRKAKLEMAESGGIAPSCARGSLVESDLKLGEWLYDAVLPGYVDTTYGDSLAKAAAKKDAISHEVSFVIAYGGNVTPSWKLVRVSADQGSGSLFNAQRTKTQDMIITLGPPAPDGQLAQAAQNAILASQIGQSVANAVKGSQP
jgi:hypothetical protein